MAIYVNRPSQNTHHQHKKNIIINPKIKLCDVVGSVDYVGVNYFSSYEVQVSKVTSTIPDMLNDVDAVFNYNSNWKRYIYRMLVMLYI